MARCRYCGKDAWTGFRVCRPCRLAWKARRVSAFNAAVAELGPLTSETHKAILKRTKQLEKRKAD